MASWIRLPLDTEQGGALCPSRYCIKEHKMKASKTKRNVYRVCFDFSTLDGAIDFFDSFVQCTLEPDPEAPYCEGDFRDTHLVHKDYVHDSNKKVHEMLVRGKDLGNGRPVKWVEVEAEHHKELA